MTPPQGPEPTAPEGSLDKGQLEQRFKALLTDWGKHELVLHTNRDAYELDVTVDQARARKMVLGNETFIGRRVIAENIKRELPVFIQYLKGSYRHVTASGPAPLDILNAIEAAVTKAVRTGPWLATHIKAVMAMALHGRGVFMVIPDAENTMDTEVVYVPTTDFIVPINSRDFQQAPMVPQPSCTMLPSVMRRKGMLREMAALTMEPVLGPKRRSSSSSFKACSAASRSNMRSSRAA